MTDDQPLSAQREDALFLGPPGTGKSHLAQAIGRAAILQAHRVLYRGHGLKCGPRSWRAQAHADLRQQEPPR